MCGHGQCLYSTCNWSQYANDRLMEQTWFCLDQRASELSGRVRCCCRSPLSRWALIECIHIYVCQPRCAQVHMGEETDHPQGSGKAFQHKMCVKWLNEESALLFTERLSASHAYPAPLHTETHTCTVRLNSPLIAIFLLIWPAHFSFWQIVRFQTVFQQNTISNRDMMQFISGI